MAEATLAAISEPDQELAGVVLRWELQMLRLVGHLPSLRAAHCGQDVADGPWWFSERWPAAYCVRAAKWGSDR
ncbi:MAG: hypothetical protein R3C56_18530 [Pirellulaceae bacterium]